MSYSAHQGDLNDPTYRNQIAQAFGGVYLLDGCGVSIGNSTSAVESVVSPGQMAAGYQRPPVDQQTVTHDSGEPGERNDPEAEWRVDAVVLDDQADASVIKGTPLVLADGTDTAGQTSQRPPKVLQPLADALANMEVVCLAFVVVAPGVASSADVYDSELIPRQVRANALNHLELIPGRDLQAVIDNAREGQTLSGDRSQVITLYQPLTVGVKDLTLRDVHFRYADQAAVNDTDDMLTFAADGITLENATIDGNKAGQTAEPDGVTVSSSGCTVGNVEIEATAGHGVNVNAGTSAVVDTTVVNLDGTNLRKDTLIVQGDARRTAAEKIAGSQSDTRGTVTVRNGPRFTELAKIHGYQQNYSLQIEDFGSGNESTAPITDTSVNGLRGRQVDRLLANATSSGIGHFGLALETLRGQEFGSPTGGGLVDISNVGSVAISDMQINDPFGGQWGIFGSNCASVTVLASLFRSHGKGGIVLSDTTGIRVDDTSIGAAPDGSIDTGIQIGASNSDTRRVSLQAGNIITGHSGDALRFNESGDNRIESVFVQNNFFNTSTITRPTGFSDRADVLFADNLPP